MANIFQNLAEKYLTEYRKRKGWQRVVSTLAAVVVFCTTYALILPAITWERSLICEVPEHTHTNACYENITIPAADKLICETAEHTHTDECYENQLVLTCEVEVHEHTDECYEERDELTCKLEESEGHKHTEECYEHRRELVCEIENTHEHTDECYTTVRVLKCETDEHKHTEECYKHIDEHIESYLLCGMEAHTHTAECFDAPPAVDDGFYCGKIAHKHNQYCYFEDGTLRCTIEEHEHDISCESDKSADIETVEEWEKAVTAVELTGNWAKDILAIADTQIGYRESEKNFEIIDGVRAPYTRYGVWSGDPYGAWSAKFASFCIYYSEISQRIIPTDTDVGAWIEKLKAADMFVSAKEYVPVPGDLIFFDWDEDGTCDHVGFIKDLAASVDGEAPRITVISGDQAKSVCTDAYAIDDTRITGFGTVPVNPDYEAPTVYDLVYTELESYPASDGAVAVIKGDLPEGAYATIAAVTLTQDDLIKYFGERKAAVLKSFVAYDIKIIVDGAEYEPAKTVSVEVRKPDIDLENGDSFAVAHINGESDTLETVSSDLASDGVAVSFDGESFSIYIIYTFTVDFHYGDVTFSIEGESEITITELFEKLNITRSPADVASVTFSDPSLIEVAHNGEDFVLISLEAFDTNETLTIGFTDGEVYVIGVTDAQIASSSGTWEKVTAIDSINDIYIIVHPEGTSNYALSNNNGALGNVPITITDPTNGVYKISTAIPESAQMKFTVAGNSTLTTRIVPQNNTSYNLRLYNSEAFGSTSTNVSIQYLNNYWYVYRYNSGTYYLPGWNSTSGNFERQSTSGTINNAMRMDIYKYTPSAGTVRNGTGSSTSYTVPVFVASADDYGNLTSPFTRKDDLTISSSTATNIETVFESYGISYKTLSAYYGMAGTPQVSGVTALSRQYVNNDRRLNVQAGSANNYYNASNEYAIYITYTEPTGGGFSGGDIDPDKPPDHYKRIDSFKEGDDNPDTELDDNATDLTDLYRLYLDVGPESSLQAVNLVLVIDRSSSMNNTDSDEVDSFDLQGELVSRQYAMNSLINGLDAAHAGQNNTSTLYDNSIIKQFLSLNPNNKISIIDFSTDGEVQLDWTSTGSTAAGDTHTGTNYCAGLRYAGEQWDALDDDDDAKKIMFFISDGTPTAYYPGDGDTTVYSYSTYIATTEPGYSNSTARKARMKERTEYAIDTFKETYDDVTIYTVAIGDVDDDTINNYLNRLSTNGTTFTGHTYDSSGNKVMTNGHPATDFSVILNTIDEYSTQGVGHYTNFEVTDTLSDYVEFADPLDLKIQRIPKNTTDGTGDLLYSNADGSTPVFTTLGSSIIKSVTISGKTVSVDYADGFEEQGDYNYSISFNVKVNQDAYDDYAENVADGKPGYYSSTAADNTIRGDDETDYLYNENDTSSGHPGFYANASAVLEYSHRHAGREPDPVETVDFSKPVVQVDTDKIKVVKVWADGSAAHVDDTITANLYMKYEGVDTLIKSAVLSKDNSWTYTFTDLPKGYEYSVTETGAPTGYTPDYSFNEATGTWTITNSTTRTITFQKTNEAGTAITGEAKFSVYADALKTTKIGDYTTNASGQFSVEGLQIGHTYYIEETQPPAGFNRMEGLHSFTVNVSGLGVTFGDLYLTPDTQTTLKVKNYTGYAMPETGGITKVPIYVLGGSILAATLIYGYVKRRKKKGGSD